MYQITVEQMILQWTPMPKDLGSIPGLGKTFSKKFNCDLILSDNRSTCLYIQVEKVRKGLI